MKAEVNEEETSLSTTSTSPSTPASGAVTPTTETNTADADGETIVEDETPAADPTVAAASTSRSASPKPSTSSTKPSEPTKLGALKSKKDDNKEGTPAATTKKKSQNTVGKVTNLISTDMTNILEGRDFLIPLIHCPLQVIICVLFLYGILGYA